MDMDRYQCIPPKSKQPRGVDPKTVLQRLLTPRPFSFRASLGNADTVISAASNAEKMFAYYPDYTIENDVCDTTNSVRSSLHSSLHSTSIQDTSNDIKISSPQPRWLPSPKNRLWGNIVHTPMRSRRKSQDLMSCSKEARRSSFLASEIIEKVEHLEESQASTNERGQNIPSLAEADKTNLSPTMRRALKLLKIHSSTAVNQQQADGDSLSAGGTKHLVATETHCPETAVIGPKDIFDAQISSDTISSVRSIDSPTQHSRSRLSDELRTSVLESISNYRGHPMVPTNLDAEFVVMKDTLDPSGGVKVGFGGLTLLQEHIAKFWVNRSTALALEFEFCTHGFDAVSAGDILKSKYYR